MSTYEIPLVSMPQTFSISLGGVTYNLTLRWIDAGQFWVLDIDDQNNLPILNGVPLITGVDLLEPYEYLNFGGQLFVTSDFDTNAPPTSSNLGSQSHLYFVTAS